MRETVGARPADMPPSLSSYYYYYYVHSFSQARGSAARGSRLAICQFKRL